MRQILPALAAFAVALPFNAPAQTTPSGSWQPMGFHDLRIPSNAEPLQTLIWPDAIAEANAYVTKQLKRPLNGKNALVTVLAATYQLWDGRILIISTALVRSCDSGANDKGAEIEPSLCPLRIVILKDAKIISAQQETGCYADHSDPALPEKNSGDISWTLFDPKAGTIAYRTIIAGKAVAGCERT